MFINYKMPDFSCFEKASTTGAAQVAPGVRVSIDPDKGEVRSASMSDHFALDFIPSDSRPSWIELVFVLADSTWRQCRQICLMYRASGTGIQVTTALRLGQMNGFHDNFGTEAHLVNRDVAEFRGDFRMSPRSAASAQWMDLHLFFSATKGTFRLYDLALTGVI